MPEGTSQGTGTGTATGTSTGAGTGQETPAWTQQLPSDLKDNAAFTSYKTIGDLAKSHLETATKLSEAETRLKESIPKLPDNATDEERGLYYDALGRPKEAKEYEFDSEDKNAPEWTGYWKKEFHSLGFTKTQAKTLSAAFNKQMQAMVDAHNASIQKENSAAETKLRTEFGEKFDANVELAKRMYQKHLGSEFDKDFSNGNAGTRFQTVRLLLKLAALTGEDRSPQGGGRTAELSKTSFVNYDRSPAPPARG